ncbi:MAG: hypothetical protein AB7V32_00725 [Candidatus Berkiella sp.]
MIDSKLHQLVKVAYQSSDLVQDAVLQHQQYYQKIYEEQNALLEQNAIMAAQFTQSDLSVLQAQVIARIDNDISCIQSLNQMIVTNTELNADATWSLRTNKMENILFNAKELILDDAVFIQLVKGQTLDDLSPPEIVILGDSAAIYGNSKLTYLNSAILEINLSLLGQESKIQHVLMNDYNNWVDTSAIVHVTPLPISFSNIDIVADFSKNFSFYFSDPLTPEGFTFVHSGYAFGGHREEARYPDGKNFGPEDCSSWIAKIIGSEVLFSTIDQLYTYRMGQDEATRDYVDATWLNSDSAKTMDVLDPVYVENPFTDIHPGQVFAFRTFDTADHSSSAGISGHTALVIGVRENGNVVTLNYARNMPIIEGFGISEYSWQSTASKETMFFDVKPKPLMIQDILQVDHIVPDTIIDAYPQTYIAPIDLQDNIVNLTVEL